MFRSGDGTMPEGIREFTNRIKEKYPDAKVRNLCLSVSAGCYRICPLVAVACCCAVLAAEDPGLLL